MMVGNHNKTAMCIIYGKVMRDDNLIKHKNEKRGEMSHIVQNEDGCQQIDNLTVDVQHKNVKNETQAEDRRLKSQVIY